MIKWNEIDKSLFLQKLTEELKKPEKGIMDEVLAAHLILGSPAKNAIGNILKGLFGKSGE